MARKLTAYAITGLGFSPVAVWYDGDQFFGIIDVLSYVPERWTGAVPALSKAQDDALAARAPGLLAQVAEAAAGRRRIHECADLRRRCARSPAT